MTDSRYEDRPERPQRSASDTRSSYEEAIRRSNERLNRVQSRARFDADAAQGARYDSPAQRSTVRTDPRSSSSRPRQTIRIDDYARTSEAQQGYSQDAHRQPVFQREQQQRTQQPPASMPAQNLSRAQQQAQRGVSLANPYSRGSRGQRPATTGYREQQLQSRSRESGNYQARPSGLPFKAPSAPSLPVLKNGLVVRAVICVILLVVVIFSVTRIGPTTAARNEAQANVEAKQQELDSLNTSNGDLQSKLDNIQVTLDKYNDLVAKG